MIVVGLIVSAYHNNFGSHMWNIGFDLPDNMLNICKWCLGFTHSTNKNYVTVCFTDSCPVRTSTRRRLPAQRTALIEPLRSLLQTLTLAHHLTTFIQTPHHQLHNHHQLHHRVQCFIWHLDLILAKVTHFRSLQLLVCQLLLHLLSLSSISLSTMSLLT